MPGVSLGLQCHPGGHPDPRPEPVVLSHCFSPLGHSLTLYSVVGLTKRSEELWTHAYVILLGLSGRVLVPGGHPDKWIAPTGLFHPQDHMRLGS